MAFVIEETLEHAMLLARHMPHCDYSTVLILVLYEMGFAPKNDGFTYLKEAVAMRYENPTRHLWDDIYIEISAEHNGVGGNEPIDQAIRRTIKDAWKDYDAEIWRIIFPVMKKRKIRRPSNGDVIAGVAWFIELWKGCCKEAEYAEQ